MWNDQWYPLPLRYMSQSCVTSSSLKVTSRRHFSSSRCGGREQGKIDANKARPVGVRRRRWRTIVRDDASPAPEARALGSEETKGEQYYDGGKECTVLEQSTSMPDRGRFGSLNHDVRACAGEHECRGADRFQGPAAPRQRTKETSAERITITSLFLLLDCRTARDHMLVFDALIYAGLSR